jgi:hypothetical protein
VTKLPASDEITRTDVIDLIKSKNFKWKHHFHGWTSIVLH